MKHEYNLCTSLKFTGIQTDGGFAEFAAVPAYQLHRVPDKVTYQEAALVSRWPWRCTQSRVAA